MPLVCEHCQQPTRAVIQQEDGGLWCRDCHRDRKFSEMKLAPSTFRDEIPGGLTVENYGRNPITFYSHSERRAYMAQHGLHERDKWSPMPGTNKDPQGIPNPAGYMDAKTLENAAILISRNGAKQEPEDPFDHGGLLRETFRGEFTNRDAKAVYDGDPGRLSRLHRRTSGDH